ncbi:phospho-sugar mutase [Candidatus Rhabdochlamydia sp. T3358]|uniref:phospho-sugar mutase n=1 Tax=Candidatus Rhabdochlamydia sp. T3358 TaxID=2099795 RepID=UPI0010B065F3|nr:phospho-sugar mutase [Candidatus Rhabdochlamydia sp. T3358]VHO02068.1 Phosphoglucomutase [Candidatus Rhabdochlamydia sp. T3358]
MAIPADIQKRAEAWLNSPFDPDTQNQVRLLMQKPQELIDAFFCDLSFGTGGMRGLMGVGTNRLNIYTIQRATQGLANYLNQQKKTGKVVIGFDSRHHSKEFAEEAAKVLAANQIQVFLINELRPTPYISFACRFMQADAAIMITASHNPAQYNGYKVYWSDGGQVVPPHDTGIMQEVEKISQPSQIHLSNLSNPVIQQIGNSLDQPYLQAIAPLQVFPEQDHQTGKDLKITYTSLHGTGSTIVPQALTQWGFDQIYLVKQQCQPDGSFPTVAFPNPEYKETFTMGLKYMLDTKSDLLIATDPDADRIGIAVLHHNKPTLLDGNQVAAICADYLCEVLSLEHKMPARAAIVTTIVSTQLLKSIAKRHKIAYREVLTGFKYIGELIHKWEKSQESYHFLFGAEESYGYLIGTHARDKDAIVMSCLIAEIALYAKRQNQTLQDRLEKIYQTYGLFQEKQFSMDFAPGKEGMEKIEEIMQHLRQNPLKTIAGIDVLYIEDYQKRIRFTLEPKKEEALELPSSNVLVFGLKDQSRLIIRPSGTEPKIKIYLSTHLDSYSSLEQGIDQCQTHLNTLLTSFKQFIV